MELCRMNSVAPAMSDPGLQDDYRSLDTSATSKEDDLPRPYRPLAAADVVVLPLFPPEPENAAAADDDDDDEEYDGEPRFLAKLPAAAAARAGAAPLAVGSRRSRTGARSWRAARQGGARGPHAAAAAQAAAASTTTTGSRSRRWSRRQLRRSQRHDRLRRRPAGHRALCARRRRDSPVGVQRQGVRLVAVGRRGLVRVRARGRRRPRRRRPACRCRARRRARSSAC